MAGRRHTLRRRQVIPRPIAEVFPFVEEAANSELITPPWLHFRITAPSEPPLRRGTLISYRLPFGPLGELAAPLIAAQLWPIFLYRRRRVRRLLGEGSESRTGDIHSPPVSEIIQAR